MPFIILMGLMGDDEQALDVLGNPSAIRLRLVRSMATGWMIGVSGAETTIFWNTPGEHTSGLPKEVKS